MSLQRDRMSQDMKQAGFALRTQEAYIAAIRHMAEFLGRGADVLNPEDIRAWDDEMHRRDRSPVWHRVHVAASRFYCLKTVFRPESRLHRETDAVERQQFHEAPAAPVCHYHHWEPVPRATSGSPEGILVACSAMATTLAAVRHNPQEANG